MNCGLAISCSRDKKFVRDGLKSVIETGWVLQLQQYKSGFLEKVQSMRTPRTAAQMSTQSEKPKSEAALDSFESGTTQLGGDDAMLEDKTRHLMLGSGHAEVRSARILSMKNLKLLRERPSAPKYVREFAPLIRELACEGQVAAEFGMVEVKIWEVRLRCEEKGRKCLKEEEKLQRAKEKSRKKKEKKKEKKRAVREKKTRKKLGKRRRYSDTSSSDSWSSDSSLSIES